MTKLKLNFTINSTHCKKPLCCIKLNDNIVFDGDLTNEIEIDVIKSGINVLTIEHYGKHPDDTIVDNDGNIIGDVGFNLESVYLDILQFTPVYLNWHKFYPDYTNFGSGPVSLQNNLYFGFNGKYILYFYGDIIKQKYHQFWVDEEQANFNLQLPDDNFNRFGEKVSVDNDLDISIHDLARMVKSA